MDGGSWLCTGDRDQDYPQEKEMQKKQNGSLRRWEVLQIAEERREIKGKGGKERYALPIWMQSSNE